MSDPTPPDHEPAEPERSRPEPQPSDAQNPPEQATQEPPANRSPLADEQGPHHAEAADPPQHPYSFYGPGYDYGPETGQNSGYYNGYGYGAGSGYGYGYGYGYAPPQRVRPSAWTWPVVVAVSVVVSLIAGALSATLLFGARDGWFQSGIAELDARAPLSSDNRDIAKVADLLLPSTVQVVAEGKGNNDATGSGFVIDNDGHVITNNHVVAEAADGGKFTVIDYRGHTHKATIVGRSAVYDVAVLEVTGISGLPPAALGSSEKMHVGDPVVALGSPLGLSSTVTSGIISALDRPVTAGPSDRTSYINAVQTDAAINPGNSGGPLVNLQGQVIGVNSAIATVGKKGAAGNIGVGFAIPMEQVRITAQQIIDTGEAEYPVIGATVDIGSARDGAVVADVPAGTPADRAGLQKGDLIVGIDDYIVHDAISLIVLIRSHQPGDTVTLRVRRDEESLTLRIVLEGKAG